MTSESEVSRASGSKPGNSDIFDVIIVGAGAAGIGVGIALAHSGVGNFVIIDRDSVGSSSLHGQTRHVSSRHPSRVTR